MKFKCKDCGKEFTSWEVTEWLDDDTDEIDDEEGDVPCCPYCGSDNVKER